MLICYINRFFEKVKLSTKDGIILATFFSQAYVLLQFFAIKQAKETLLSTLVRAYIRALSSLNQFNQAYCPINAHKLT